MSKTILIAESGSTKTDWCLLQAGKAKHFKTQGINPYFQTGVEIQQMIATELKINTNKTTIDEIIYYGSGIANSEKKKVLVTVLKKHFNAKKITVESDMLAAAIATCNNTKGITCILGTGSNSCYFDGKKIKTSQASLGFVLGDEGGGNHIGRKLIQYYMYGVLDADLVAKFDAMYGYTKDEIIESIYRKPFPNRYLAQFAKFCFANRGHFMIENILEDCINDMFINHLIRYKESFKVPIHFTGSVAYECRDILAQLCAQYEMKLGTILQSPMQGLIKVYKKWS